MQKREDNDVSVNDKGVKLKEKEKKRKKKKVAGGEGKNCKSQRMTTLL